MIETTSQPYPPIEKQYKNPDVNLSKVVCFQCNSHPTLNEVFDQARKFLPKISLGTVYRNLQLLAEIGEIRKLEFADGKMRFDNNVEPHLHVRFGKCGEIQDVTKVDTNKLRKRSRNQI